MEKKKSGVKRISWCNTYQRWVVKIPLPDNKWKYLGYFKNIQDAKKKLQYFYNSQVRL